MIAGLLAAILQAGFRVNSLPAYGLCMACHGQEVASWLLPFRVRAVPRPSAPLLTTVGVLIGAFMASWRYREFRWHQWRLSLRPLVLGLLVGCAAIVAAGCPTRLWLRLGYGDGTVVLPVLGLIIGIYTGTLLLRWRSAHD